MVFRWVWGSSWVERGCSGLQGGPISAICMAIRCVSCNWRHDGRSLSGSQEFAIVPKGGGRNQKDQNECVESNSKKSM